MNLHEKEIERSDHDESDGYRRIKKTSLAFVEKMKIGDEPGVYAKEPGEGESFYGSYHAAHVLDLFGELRGRPTAELDAWAEIFRRRQTETGYFSNRPDEDAGKRPPERLESVWHTTRGAIWALRVLGRRPERPMAFLEPLLSPDALAEWVRTYDWTTAWAAANQVLACVTALHAQRDWFGDERVDDAILNGLFPALDELADPETGYWGTQFGGGLLDGLFGAIHVAPIYFAHRRTIPFIERNVDSTIACQRDDGSYWPGGSDCPDFDGAYMLLNLHRLTEYRKAEMEEAARRYLKHAEFHEDPDGVGWLLHRRGSSPEDWKPRPHWIWKDGDRTVRAEYRDDDPGRTHIMLGTWFYPLSIALIAMMLGDTGYEGPYRLNGASLHQKNVRVNS